MQDDEKIQIAKDFIAEHKQNDPFYWVMHISAYSDINSYLEIYNNIIGGVYGECRDNAEYDDDYNVSTKATDREIEIGRFDSKTGNPIIFEFLYLE